MHALSKHKSYFWTESLCSQYSNHLCMVYLFFFFLLLLLVLLMLIKNPMRGDENLKINGAEEPTTWFMDALWNQKSKEKVEIRSFVFCSSFRFDILTSCAVHAVRSSCRAAVHATYTLLTRAWHFKAYSYVKHMGSQTDRGLFEWFLIKWKTGKEM